MKQKMLSGILVIMMSLMFLIPTQVLAVTETNDYIIQSYNINMIVNEDNTFDITENITAYFNVKKHGIYREIPLKNSITRADGTKSNNIAKITDIQVSDNYTISNKDGYKVIKIGNDNQTFIGTQSYTIKYKYDIGKDPLKNADELYFNLIGDKWDTSIRNVFFTITMPKSFDKSLLGFSSGNAGSTDSSNVIYSVNGNTIIGSTINTLNAGQALTVRLTLPEGYFIVENKIDIFSIGVIILCMVFILIADRLWIKYGKDDQVVETVEFYPPEGYNSAEVGFLYKGSVDRKGVISLLIYLANQGYLKIEETVEKKSKSFRITKIKDYTGNSEVEKIFFDGLFKVLKDKTAKKSRTEEVIKEKESQESVTVSDLYDKFYKTVDEIRSKINSKENKKKIFTSSSMSKLKYLKIMMIVVAILIIMKPIIEYGSINDSMSLLLARNRIYNNVRKFYRRNRTRKIDRNNDRNNVWDNTLLYDVININSRNYIFNNICYWNNHNGGIAIVHENNA